MDIRGLLFELLLTGFFAVACMRARLSSDPGERVHFGDIFRFSGRIERLRRSRWQWVCILLLLILARVQWSIPVFVEVMFAALFVAFVAIPGEKGIHRQALQR